MSECSEAPTRSPYSEDEDEDDDEDEEESGRVSGSDVDSEEGSDIRVSNCWFPVPKLSSVSDHAESGGSGRLLIRRRVAM